MAQTPERYPVSGPPCSARLCHDATTLYVAVAVPLRSPASVHRQGPQGVVDQTEVVFRDASGTKPGPTFSVLGNVSGGHEVSGFTNTPAGLNLGTFRSETNEWLIWVGALASTLELGRRRTGHSGLMSRRS